jgi:hypothetical protein
MREVKSKKSTEKRRQQGKAANSSKPISGLLGAGWEPKIQSQGIPYGPGNRIVILVAE